MADVPEGWYPDPEDPDGRLRWWDGTRWTDRLSAHDLQTPPATTPPPPTPGPTGRNRTMIGAVLGGLALGGAVAVGWYLGTGRSAPEVVTHAAEEQAPDDDVATGPDLPGPTASESPTAAPQTAEPDGATEAVAHTRGGPGWIVIVESLDVLEHGPEDAERLAEGYRAQGLDADVISSDEYGSLNAGYWVVHVGGWWPPSEEDAAASYCRSIRGVVANCYQRFAGDQPPGSSGD